MKRFLLFLAVAGLVGPAHSQFFNGPMIPTTPPASMSLGAGLPAALANPANSNGGVPLLGGSVTSGDCLTWGATGIQDAGSACATSNVTGTGAPVATSLSNRATDFGVTFNLKTDFGAACNGATDDTTAIQNWLNKAVPGVHLVAPAGTCLFSSPLTITAVNQLTVSGAGPTATIFKYSGASTTADLITFGTNSSGGVYGDRFNNFSIRSSTTMTGGYAFHIHALFDGVLDNVWADDVNEGGSGPLCGGLWLDGASSVDVLNASGFSKQNCGDGIRVNAAQGASAELRIVGGAIGGAISSGTVSGFANGLHMAGGFGGMRCDQSDIHNNTVGVLIDNAVTASANREFDQGSTCAIDTMGTAGVIVNDAYASGGTVDLAGWEASTVAGHGIVIESWSAGDVEIRGDKIYNNCGSGIFVQDTSAHIGISSATVIDNNGTTGAGSNCTTWQAGAGAGIYGYGVYATGATNNVFGFPQYIGNTVSTYNALSGLSQAVSVEFSGVGQMVEFVSPSGAQFLGLNAPTGKVTALSFYNGGTEKWSLGNNAPGNTFCIWDEAQSGVPCELQLTTSGAVSLGESGSGAVTVQNNLVVDGSSIAMSNASSNPDIYLNGPTAGAAGIVLELNGAVKSSVGVNTTYAFEVYDQTASAYFIGCTTGGNCTLGKPGSGTITIANNLTVAGVAQLASYTVSSLATAVPCSSTTAGALAYVTDASSPSWNATLSGGGSTHTLAMCNGTNWTAG